MILRYIIEQDGYRVKSYLEEKKIPDQVFKDIRKGNGQFIVNDQCVEDYFLLQKNDLLEVVIPRSEQGENIISTYGEFEILYEDAYLLIINKQANLATIPTKEHYACSLANYVMSYYCRKGIASNIHFVSRLDAATSGIIMLAKNSYVTYLLQNTAIKKMYLLELEGHLENKEGIITAHIEKDPNSVIKRTLVDKEPNSKTIYKVIEEKENTSLVEALLCTGKTHQLRLHFSSLNHPILGDELYGNKSEDGILKLHSYHLEFIHPITKQEILIENYPVWYAKKMTK